MVIHRVPKPRASKLAKQAGFTIIELMVATTVFSLVLFALTYGVMQISNNYYDGIILNETRVATNGIINNISQSLEFNGELIQPLAPITGATEVQGFCVGTYRYSYLPGYELVPNGSFSQEFLTSPHVFVVDNLGAGVCNQSTTPQNLTSGGLTLSSMELMAPQMRLVNFFITRSQQLYSNLYFYQVDARVLYGQTSDIANETQSPSYPYDYNVPGSSAICNGGVGFQFCAVSEISTYITQRSP